MVRAIFINKQCEIYDDVADNSDFVLVCVTDIIVFFWLYNGRRSFMIILVIYLFSLETMPFLVFEWPGNIKHRKANVHFGAELCSLFLYCFA